MIGEGKRRKDIVDNNNYIGKIGKISFVCPYCGNLYSAECKLDVDFDIIDHDVNLYKIKTPEIVKDCACGYRCIQVDNAIGVIVKKLVDKGYQVMESCEGHAYLRDAVLSYSFPYLKIKGNIKPIIDNEFRNQLLVFVDFEGTIITIGKCMNDMEKCPCESLEEFNELKNRTIDTLQRLVDSLPVIEKTTYRKYASCGCEACYLDN